MKIRKILLPVITIVLLLTLPSFSGKKKVNIWMIGDSTMAQKKPERAPESGWGEAMKQLVTDKALVHNHAASGRSSRSFIAQKRWENVLDSVQKGDYVIIQFGHNDEKSDTLLYTEPSTTYKEFLKKIIDDSRAKGANPVICSSIVRRHFDGNGNLKDTHGNYIRAAREIADETQTPYVDMEALTRKLVTELGPEKSKSLFVFCNPGECPHRKSGVQDSTHLNFYGSHEVARLFVKEAKKQKLTLGKLFKMQ